MKLGKIFGYRQDNLIVVQPKWSDETLFYSRNWFPLIKDLEEDILKTGDHITKVMPGGLTPELMEEPWQERVEFRGYIKNSRDPTLVEVMEQIAEGAGQKVQYGMQRLYDAKDAALAYLRPEPKHETSDCITRKLKVHNFVMDSKEGYAH